LEKRRPSNLSTSGRQRYSRHDLLRFQITLISPFLPLPAGITQIIEEVIAYKERKKFPNMHVVSNKLKVDDSGMIVGFHGPLIHVLNKNEQTAHEAHFSWIKKVEKRRNVILMGDSPGDAEMADGLGADCDIIKIGFLNKKVNGWLDKYKELFDVVVINDGTMEFSLSLLEEVINGGGK